MNIKIVVLFFVSLLIVEGGTATAQNWDINLLKDININRNQQLDESFKGVSTSVYPMILLAPATCLIYGVVKKDSITLRNSLIIGASIATNIVFTYGLKYGINRTRPYLTYPILDPVVTESSPSFPSGHTATAFSIATSVSLCYPKWYIITPFYLWATSVGYSRLHLGVHYPSDVFIGALIGSGSAYLSYKANRWIQKKTHKKSAH